MFFGFVGGVGGEVEALADVHDEDDPEGELEDGEEGHGQLGPRAEVGEGDGHDGNDEARDAVGVYARRGNIVEENESEEADQGDGGVGGNIGEGVVREAETGTGHDESEQENRGQREDR